VTRDDFYEAVADVLASMGNSDYSDESDGDESNDESGPDENDNETDPTADGGDDPISP
jgi:hypothetical protein